MVFKGRRKSPCVIACVACSGLVLCYSLSAHADDALEVPSPSNYGGAGLLDMRTARFFPDGYLNFTSSLTKPDDRYAITVQALPWAEATFRYITDPAYGGFGVDVSNFDLKFRLSRETEYVPEIALGLQDLIGLREYGAEYLVASKRWGEFDFTLGMGWGRLGSRGTFENPFGLISKSILAGRGSAVGQGGTVNFASFFHGPDVGLFGGVEYQTPIQNLKFKVEYSSDAYVEDSLSGRNYGFPVNAGFSYRPFSWLDIGVSLMHGHYPGLRISALMDAAHEIWPVRPNPLPRFRARPEEAANTLLQQDPPPSTNGPAIETRYVDLTAQHSDEASKDAAQVAAADLPSLPAIGVPNTPVPPQQKPAQNVLDADALQKIKSGLENQKLMFMGAGLEGSKLVVLIENPRYRRDTEAVSRAARVLSAAAPPEIDSFEITLMVVGQPTTTVTFPRTEIDKLARRESSPAELFQVTQIEPGASAPLNHLQPDLFPQFNTLLFPVFQQSLFDPSNPIFVRLGVGGIADLRLARGWFLDAFGIASIYDNFNQIQRVSNSVLPHVRTDLAEYLKQGRFSVQAFESSYFFKLAPEVFGRFTVGYLEEMFAGVGGELLYRPYDARWAIGLDAWEVRQRGFDVLADLRHYQAFTGHITAYYQLPWHDVQIAVSGGQYLAEDKGVTFQLSRRFSTGVVIGAWATFTNVSAARFGEGSFDKGIRIIIPFEWVAPFPTQAGYDLQLRNIQRDGGQRLAGDTILYGITDPSTYGAFTQDWSSLFK